LPLQRPIVSVVMAVRDGAAYLPEAIESVREQTLEDLELVVVDDGSTDETPQILADFAGRDRRIRVMRQDGGVSRARNRGCREACGPYLACLDADDAALPDRLARQVAFLEDNRDAAVVGGGGIMVDHRGVQFGVAAYPEDPADVTRYLQSGRVPLIHSAATMRADAFHAASGYRPAFERAQDYDLWLRIALRGRITNLREPVVRYRVHARQASTENVTKTATAVAVALGAARIRARGEPDPVDTADSLDADLVERMGISAEEIAAEEVRFGLWMARTMEKAGYHARTEPLWSQAAASAAVTADPRAMRARVLQARADAWSWRQRRLRARFLRLRANMLDPRGAAGRLWNALTRPAAGA
jgi:glycosyltransferase involved in cell wall biosynthesis